MSPPGVHLLLPALGVMLTLLSVPPVDGVQYYYYYQAQQHSSYGCTTYSYNYGTSCHIDTCYSPQTWNQCCLQYFTYYNTPYKVCMCTPGTRCAYSQVVNNPTTVPTPTTTTTQPTTSTTTAPTTTAPTTTVAFKSLCSTNFRLLNGNAAQLCDFSGVANITIKGGNRSLCNAVYTPANVNGTKKLTFVTSAECVINMNNNMASGIPMDIQIGDIALPVVNQTFTTLLGPDGVAFIEMNPMYANTLRSLGCQKPACPYDNSPEMAGKIDYNKCKLVSWGSDIPNNPGKKMNLMEAELRFSPFGCKGAAAGPPNSYCFQTVSNKNVLCSGDIGAPIYCQAPSNGQWILFGVAAKGQCDLTPYVNVILIPT